MELKQNFQFGIIFFVLFLFVFRFGSCQDNAINNAPVSTVTSCGILNRIDPEPFRESTLRSGDWPWLTTIYRQAGRRLKRTCVGTLIGSRAVLTSARCVFQSDNETQAIPAEEIFLKFGETNLVNWNDPNVISATVKNISIHPDFQPSRARADIAILELQNYVKFTDFIKPACLFLGNHNSSFGKYGFVARWNSNNAYLKTVQLVSNFTCSLLTDEVLNFTSEKTWCSGSGVGDGFGSCLGDSGSGYLLKQNGRWAVSAIYTGIMVSTEGTCPFDQHLSNTDLPKYAEWIRSNLPKPDLEIDEILEAAQEVCGQNDHSDPEPLKETALAPGEWPWMVTLHRFFNDAWEFSCTGVLISSRAVLTCGEFCLDILATVNQQSTKYVVRLGASTFHDWNKDTVQTPAVKYYVIRPKPYTTENRFQGGIGIVVLRDEVTFTNRIRPACLWSGDVDPEGGEYGYVARVGFEGVNNPPLLTSAKIVSNETCLESSEFMPGLVSNITVCAGDRNFLGPTVYDIGSGLVVKRNDRWMVRGVISSALATPFNPSDTKKEFVVYTDVAKTLDWIKSVHLNIKKSDALSLALISSEIDGICGEVATYFRVRPLTYGGVEIERKIWPWLVAIYKTRNNITSYICGGTLISSTVIVSAAHCFFDRYGELKSDDISVYLGLHELSETNATEVVAPSIKNITLHFDYDNNRLKKDADIAIITLNEKINFTEYIRPACIWASSESSHDPVGYVVGWGIDEAGQLSEKPRQVSANMVGGEVCLRSNTVYSEITSSRTFCAGNRDNTGPCQGDSGSGFLIGNNGKWFLRGIVSTSLTNPSLTKENLCNLREYVVYSDVSKFTNWIQRVITS